MGIKKGSYGYRRALKIRGGIFVACFLCVIGGLSLLSRRLSGNASTLCLVSAILLVLPMANRLAPLLVSLPFDSMDAAWQRQLEQETFDCARLYDLILTNGKDLMPLDCVVILGDRIYGYLSKTKTSPSKTGDFLVERLSCSGLLAGALVYESFPEFLKAVKEAKGGSSLPGENREGEIAQILKSLSM